MIGLFVFLGNPGSQYKKTRHNLAWLILENLSIYPDLLWKEKFKGDFALINKNGDQKVFLRPSTYMNLSGESVQAALTFFKNKPKEVLVFHDDIELPFGQVSLKFSGGLAGHNGLKSIANSLGTKDFYRMRLGVGRPLKGEAAAHVLGRFTSQEEAELEFYFKKMDALVPELLAGEPGEFAPLKLFQTGSK